MKIGDTVKCIDGLSSFNRLVTGAEYTITSTMGDKNEAVAVNNQRDEPQTRDVIRK